MIVVFVFPLRAIGQGEGARGKSYFDSLPQTRKNFQNQHIEREICCVFVCILSNFKATRSYSLFLLIEKENGLFCCYWAF